MEKEKNKIKVENISKKFTSDFKIKRSAILHIKNIFSKKQKKERTVLDNISFSVSSGEVIGIIGRNGSGKSTLLRIIAGILKPSEGTIKTNGKIAYITSVNQGIIQKLTIRENIYLVGSMMGLSQKDIKDRFNEIIEFSGLERFIDMKVYQFSSGMISRLNFSIVINCINHQKPDILLLDEVLSAGGDIDFQEKANLKIKELIKSGAAVIIISHGLNTIKECCEKVIWLDKGKILMFDRASEVIKKYNESKKIDKKIWL